MKPYVVEKLQAGGWIEKLKKDKSVL